MLELRNVNTFYGNIQALRDVNIRINEGEIVTLIGANGAGKSTTLMTICGGTPPRSGEVLFRGHPIHTLRPNKIVALGISQVPEGRLIFPDLTVQENLDLGAFLRNDKENIKKDLDYIFDLFPILAQRRAQTGGTLSGGEQQMLAISRAIMARPTLLLLDEPSLGLAPIIIQQIFSIIEKINADGTTVFLVEQNANQALRIANRAYENIADQGGLRVAYTAYHNSLEGKEKPAPIDGFTPEQRFYLAYAQLWAQNIRDEEIARLTKLDVHSLGKWRVDATLRNLQDFYDAFSITDGAMYMPVEERVIIW